MIKAVIFDLDGLILDTEKLLVKFWCQAANEAGFPMQTEHALHIRSLGRKFAIPYLSEIFGPEFDYMKIRSRRMELMAEHIREHGLEKKPGLEELLSYLQRNRIPAAVATATDKNRAEEYLQQTGLLHYFSNIVCATMVENGKPKPDIYLFAAARLGLKPQECMALEDSPNGIYAASSAGCVTVMVPDLTEPDEEVLPLIYTSAESLADVPAIIKQLS
ncbi:MAG: HAD family phosphatase [Oscillospiraceae bacterium]|nr:HAD family phosphatase [Oscillospiraceae bacterium]